VLWPEGINAEDDYAEDGNICLFRLRLGSYGAEELHVEAVYSA
jgi:hypothetical protein